MGRSQECRIPLEVAEAHEMQRGGTSAKRWRSGEPRRAAAAACLQRQGGGRCRPGGRYLKYRPPPEQLLAAHLPSNGYKGPWGGRYFKYRPPLVVAVATVPPPLARRRDTDTPSQRLVAAAAMTGELSAPRSAPGRVRRHATLCGRPAPPCMLSRSCLPLCRRSGHGGDSEEQETEENVWCRPADHSSCVAAPSRRPD